MFLLVFSRTDTDAFQRTFEKFKQAIAAFELALERLIEAVSQRFAQESSLSGILREIREPATQSELEGSPNQN